VLRATAIGWAFAATAASVVALQGGIGDAVRQLSRSAVWRLERTVPLQFPIHHPQGMVKIGDRLFISSVEVTVAPRRGEGRADGFDRDTGEGIGHLFEATLEGRLVADVVLGEGSQYHPGGIDYDGESIWVTVAEYRPNSRSIVYRVDPATRKRIEVFRFGDHLGAIVRNPDDNTLHAVSWGSRWFYRFPLDRNRRPTNAAVPPARLRRANPSHYVDYQDCEYAGGNRMLCTGIADVARGGGERPLQLGGIDLIDLGDGRPVHQLPVGLTTATGVALTRNPSAFERTATGLRAYFLPEDGASTLYVYAVDAAR
jgi:hypothetical protein